MAPSRDARIHARTYVHTYVHTYIRTYRGYSTCANGSGEGGGEGAKGGLDRGHESEIMRKEVARFARTAEGCLATRVEATTCRDSERPGRKGKRTVREEGKRARSWWRRAEEEGCTV